ncbi:hypothetical protein F7Q95_12285 [Pseudomonas psychrophila]|nr:hypothetical protein F7Q95_12285 [Pseudomonas psychrophila]
MAGFLLGFRCRKCPCGSGLARDGINPVLQPNRGACIASKPASTRSRDIRCWETRDASPLAAGLCLPTTD